MADYSVGDLRKIREGVDYLWSQQQPCYTELGILGPQKERKLLSAKSSPGEFNPVSTAIE